MRERPLLVKYLTRYVSLVLDLQGYKTPSVSESDSTELWGVCEVCAAKNTQSHHPQRACSTGEQQWLCSHWLFKIILFWTLYIRVGILVLRWLCSVSGISLCVSSDVRTVKSHRDVESVQVHNGLITDQGHTSLRPAQFKSHIWCSWNMTEQAYWFLKNYNMSPKMNAQWASCVMFLTYSTFRDVYIILLGWITITTQYLVRVQ